MHLALIFTEGVSLKEWKRSGLILRDSLLYERLCERGHRVTFVTYGKPDDARHLPPGSRIEVLSMPRGMRRSTYGRLIPFLHYSRLRDAEIIKSHQLRGGRYAAWTARVLRKPLVARCGYIPSVFRRDEGAPEDVVRKAENEERLTLGRAKLVFVPGESESKLIQAKYGVDPGRIRLMPNWVDTDSFRPAEGPIPGPRRVCFIARFVEQKQPLRVIEAMAGIPDTELLMIGGGEQEARVRERIERLGLRAKLIGRLANEELPAYLKSSRVYVLPTLFEGGSPKTVLEAMACGLPVISTNSFGVDDAFEGGVHGLKVSPHDTNGLRHAILRLLGNPGEAAAMGARGREHVVANYSIGRAVDREIEAYEELLSGRTGRPRVEGKPDIRGKAATPVRQPAQAGYRVALIFTEGVSLRTWSQTGVVRRDSQLYERLCELGHEVFFVTYGRPDDARHLPKGSRIQVLSRPPGMTRRTYARSLAAVHGSRLGTMNLIKSHQFRGARHAVRLGRRLGVPVIARAGYLPSIFAREQGAPPRRRWDALKDEWVGCHSARAVLVPTTEDRDYLVRRYRANPDRIFISPNWIDTDEFRPMPEIERAPRRICFVGRLVPQKQALALLEISRRVGDVEVLVIGTGPLQRAMEEQAREGNLRFTFRGQTENEEIPLLLNTASVFVLPTTHEGSPKSIYEAMACGLPVVSTTVMGVEPAFEHGVEGFKLGPDDIEGMARAISELLDNPERARRMGEAGRRRALEHFGLEEAVQRELKLYRDILGV